MIFSKETTILYLLPYYLYIGLSSGHVDRLIFPGSFYRRTRCQRTTTSTQDSHNKTRILSLINLGNTYPVLQYAPLISHLTHPSHALALVNKAPPFKFINRRRH
jgi:hypothetical protein